MFESGSNNQGIVVGIDATGLRQGGGRTHLIQLLRSANPIEYGVTRVVVWGGRETTSILDDKPWLETLNPPHLDGGLLERSWWQRYRLADEARSNGVDVLLVPGGSYAGDFHPIVTMSRNMLPFEWREIRRYGLSLIALKFILLRYIQSRSFQYSDGVIFLTEYARKGVEIVTGKLLSQSVIIPHGIQNQFLMSPRTQRTIESCSDVNPFKLLYVSSIHQYKHQWQLVEAIAKIREQYGWSLTLNLVGPSYPPAMRRLEKSINEHDAKKQWVKYHGVIPHDELHAIYASADLGLFPSSCENMPNILLEKMAAGLPIASSNRGPMPEILGDAGVYFDPEQPESIAASLTNLINSIELRRKLAQAAFDKAGKYSWEHCARNTFDFLVEIEKEYTDLT